MVLMMPPTVPRKKSRSLKVSGRIRLLVRKAEERKRPIRE
jgi:hypothetical protein